MLARGQQFRSQLGSLPLALIVVILVGGLVVVLVARTMTAQSQVRFDQAYHGVLPGADAAVEISKFRLNEGIELVRSNGDSHHPREFEAGWSTIEYQDEVDGRDFTWTMTKTSEMTWEIDATAVEPRTGVARRVVATIEEEPLVDVAAFSDTLLMMRGANRADSYNSDDNVWCTGRGWVASNEDVEFAGGGAGPGPHCITLNPPGMQARTVDRVLLFDWEENAGVVTSSNWPGGDRCDSDAKNHANCTEIGGYLGPRTIPQYLDLSSDKFGEDFIENALGECDGPLEEFRASTYPRGEGFLLDTDGRFQHADNAQEAMIGPEFDLEGGHYCFERMVFDQDVQVNAGAGLKSPVIIFVEKDVIVEGGIDVGCPPVIGCVRGPNAGNETYPEAASLIIFVLNGNVTLRQHAQFAGVMYAPGAPCHGPGGSGPQADIYGSFLCKSISNAGGWRFHFDDALANLYSGEFIRSEWRELPS